jgi:hypothetical protein
MLICLRRCLWKTPCLNRILEYDQAHIDDWLVDYSVQNEEIHQTLCNLSIDFRELQNDIFNIKI